MDPGINLIRTEEAIKRIFPRSKTFIGSIAVDYKIKINQKLVSELEIFIKTSFNNLKQMGYRGLLVGLSGGMDSAVCLALARRALGKNKVKALIVDGRPYTITDTSLRNALHLTKKFDIETKIIKVDALESAFDKNLKIPRKFIRPDSLFALNQLERYSLSKIIEIADYNTFAIISTMDKSERILCTEPEFFFGHLMPLYDLYKSEVYDLGKLLDFAPDMVSSYPGCPLLPFEEPFGATTQAIDAILYLLTERHWSPHAIARKYNIDYRWVLGLQERIQKQYFRLNTQQLVLKR